MRGLMTQPRPSRRRSRWSTASIYAALVTGAVLTLAPFLLSAMTSLKSAQQLAHEPSLALPAPVTLDSYRSLFSEHSFVTPLAVTAQVTLLVLVVQLSCSILAAYAFARLTFPGRDVLFWVYLATMMIPQVATLVPLYSIMVTAGLRNTFWGIVLPTLFGSPYAVFLLREYFRGIPEDIVSAARIDGCGPMRVLRFVVLPMSRPIIATLTVITIVAQWNNFLWPRVITSGEQWQVLTVATAALQSQFNGNWTLVTAATTVALLPLIVLYLLCQRQIVSSISLAGFK